MRVIASGSGNNGCDYHRLNLPLHFISKHFDNEHFKAMDPAEGFEPYLRACDVYMFSRYPTGVTIERLAELKAELGFRVIMDLDDYWELHPKHIAYKQWYSTRTDRAIIDGIKLADLVTTTTPRLADKIRVINRNVEVLPNAIPFGFGQFTHKEEGNNEPVFIYVAGGSHLQDLDSIRNVFRKLNGTKICFSGTNDHQVYASIHNIMSDRGRLPFQSMAGQPVDSYMDLYDPGDVAIAPLENNQFNWHKSPLKVLEAGCKGIPIICSNIPPYADLPADAPVIVANSVSEWVQCIERLRKDTPMRVDIGLKLAHYVREHFDMAGVSEKRLQLIRHQYDKG